MPSPQTSRNTAPASLCIAHHLQGFLGAARPSIITMAGAGPTTLCPPALAMAKLGQGEEIILKWSCMR